MEWKEGWVLVKHYLHLLPGYGSTLGTDTRTLRGHRILCRTHYLVPYGHVCQRRTTSERANDRHSSVHQHDPRMDTPSSEPPESLDYYRRWDIGRSLTSGVRTSVFLNFRRFRNHSNVRLDRGPFGVFHWFRDGCRTRVGSLWDPSPGSRGLGTEHWVSSTLYFSHTKVRCRQNDYDSTSLPNI